MVIDKEVAEIALQDRRILELDKLMESTIKGIEQRLSVPQFSKIEPLLNCLISQAADVGDIVSEIRRSINVETSAREEKENRKIRSKY